VCPDSTKALREGTAKAGVPANTIFIVGREQRETLALTGLLAANNDDRPVLESNYG
jgi:hypothetical protein